MDVVNAFFLATSIAYVAAALLTLMDKPPLRGIPKEWQIVLYLILAIFIQIATPAGYLILGAFYSIATVTSFTGVQKWNAYWKDNPEEGDGAAQIGMTLWDLALAIAFFFLA